MARNDALQQQLIKDLLVESADGLDRFERELLALENGEGTPERLNIIFRAIHTIKGTSGCLGLSKIESVAHVGESLLSALRDGKVVVTPDMAAALFEYSDALREMLRCLEVEGREGHADYSALLQKLQDLQNAAPAAAAPAPAPAPAEKPAFGLFDEEPELPAPAKPVAAESAPTIAPAVESEPATNRAASGSTAAASAIRVDVGQLDKLMNLVGELVLARNQIVQFSAQAKESSLIAASQRLNIITTELQESVMKTRMQPIGNVWAKFPRVVRDVTHELGKDVQLILEGQGTELDRTIIEAIKDPLTHIVRNSLDHGIEKPEARVAAGKQAQGRLVLRAFHEGGQVNIEIIDDGRGIDLARVKQKAVEKGIANHDQISRMSDREAFNLVFLPGFSTAEKVTNVSGRGVGMDVVKTNIEKIGGSVDLQSEAGKGTTVKIKIPLTLAIIPALIITSGGERFAIPQVSLLELVRLEAEQARKGVESLYGAPVYRLRGQLLPLCYLNKELHLETARPTDRGDAVNIVVLQADGRQFGLVVEEINDTEEIVVKPLGKQLKALTCFAGATIMGDGRVALILDVLGLAQQANVIAEVRDRALVDKTKAESRADDRQTLLLFDAGAGSRMAIPLSMVARLEEFPRAKIEASGAEEVVQYRGQILPLIRVSKYITALQAVEPPTGDTMQVVVYSELGRSVGLVVSKINDIVQETITVKREVAGQGILGSAVIQNRVTDLVDVPAIIRIATPTFYAAGSESAAMAALPTSL
jgi:two-component system chemotaxis sensor kinase CheA